MDRSGDRFRSGAAAAEAYRVIRPGGRLVIAHFDWIAVPGNVVEATEQLIIKHHPKWALAGTPRHLSAMAARCRRRGFHRHRDLFVRCNGDVQP